MAKEPKTKKDLIARLKKELHTYIEQRLDAFRNAVNEATEVNMQRVGGWLNHTSYALDFQVDRVSALIELTTTKLGIAPEEFEAEVKRQRELRLARVEEVRQQQKAAQEAAKEAAEAPPEEEAERPPTEEEVLLAASSEKFTTGPEGDHPPEAQIFGG